ncbi:MAG: hypothetical protein CVV02_05970 [Firmicutes bacterium HGW-Firmicutes-7]|nr:MAG: hypothetical protein CVV02_05970 [Firmicutes bacterium HGW-Firmicutes-7]
MGKTLLTKNNVEEYILKNQLKIFVDKNMILTSGAKDIIRNRGISIIYDQNQVEKQNDEDCTELEMITKLLVKILKEQHGITDDEQIKNVCNLILTKINKI